MGLFGWLNNEPDDDWKYGNKARGMYSYYEHLSKISDNKEYQEELKLNMDQCNHYDGHSKYLKDYQRKLIDDTYDKIIASIEDLSDNMLNEYSFLRKDFHDLKLMEDNRLKHLIKDKKYIPDSIAGGERSLISRSVTINLFSLFDEKSKLSNDAYNKLYFKESGLTSKPTKINKECLSAIYLSAIKKGYLDEINRFVFFSVNPCPPFSNTVLIPNYFLYLCNKIIKYYENNELDNINNIFYYVYEYQSKKRNVQYEEKYIKKLNNYFSSSKTLLNLINNNYKYVSLIKEIEEYKKNN